MGAVVLRELVLKTRSYRRFRQTAISRKTLLALVDLARHTASGANRQPLKYALSCDPDHNDRVFATLAWAGYLQDWAGPAEGERPTGYIVILGDTSISNEFGSDPGIAAQTMMLGATEEGFGGCMVGSIQRDRLRKALEIEERYEILLVLALGVPKEDVAIEEVGDRGDIKYWRDDAGVHHVPKRRLDDIIVA